MNKALYFGRQTLKDIKANQHLWHKDETCCLNSF